MAEIDVRKIPEESPPVEEEEYELREGVKARLARARQTLRAKYLSRQQPLAKASGVIDERQWRGITARGC